MIRIEIPGVPVGKGRPRFAKRGAHVMAYTPEKTANYENLVKYAGQKAMDGRAPMAEAVSVDLRLFIVPPASWSQKKRKAALADELLPTSKPDIDNVLKGIADALNGVVWLDDKQITDVRIVKRYSETPKAVVYVSAALAGMIAPA